MDCRFCLHEMVLYGYGFRSAEVVGFNAIFMLAT